jgi:hypothetical protein
METASVETAPHKEPKREENPNNQNEEQNSKKWMKTVMIPPHIDHLLLNRNQIKRHL